MPGPGRPHGFPDADIGVGNIVNVKLPDGRVVPILWDGSFSINTDVVPFLKACGINQWEVSTQPIPAGPENYAVGQTTWNRINYQFVKIEKPLGSVQPTLKGAGEAPTTPDVEIKRVD